MSCETCNGGAESNCLSCATGTFLEGTKCVKSCPAGKYANTKTNKCEKCDATCATCSGPSATQCDSCSGARFLE